MFSGGNCGRMNLDSGITAHHCTILSFEMGMEVRGVSSQPGLQLTV